jgi:hypothetical protein
MRVVASPLVGVLLFGCPTPLAAPPCSNVRDCGLREVCVEGVCREVAAGACVVDTDCNVNVGEVCNPVTLACEVGALVDGCVGTSECPLDQFCNTSTGLCAALAPGFCRNEDPCGAATPICSAESEDVPGRCVECLRAEDCAAGRQCVNPGVCSGGTIQCPPNSTAGAGGTCFCNPGFDDDGNGGCVAEATGEGEGEGVGEGEGEGEGALDACAPELFGLDCALTGGPYNACSADGFCECNEGLLFLSCIFDPEAIDLDLSVCDCVRLPSAGEGEGEGGGEGEGEGEGENESSNTPCDVNGDCPNGERCLSDGDVSLRGACKQTCGGDGDCSTGVACQEEVLAPGVGYCANHRARGEACAGSLPGGTWRDVDDFCVEDPAATDDAPLLCVEGICHDVCDSEFNVDAALTCPAGTSCGALDAFSIEIDGAVAICQ